MIGSGDIVYACARNTTGAVRIIADGTTCVADLGCITDQIVKWGDAAGK